MSDERTIPWATEKVLLMAGIPLSEASDHVVALAQQCLDRAYYVDLAANELLRRLGFREVS